MGRHVLLTFVLLGACSSQSSTVVPDDAPVVPDAGAVTPAHGECGMPRYDWLPPSDVGAVLEDEAHGLVTKAEAVALRILLAQQGLILHRAPDHATRMHRIRYATQDRGQPIEATAMVVVPDVDAPQTMPVLLFLHGTSGLNDSCAPSANVDDSSSDNYKASLLLSVLASYGYILVAPDYIGMKSLGAPSPALHPYLVGEATAIASLDAVRATRALTNQLASNAVPGAVAVWGGSQGGHAAGFTVAYAPSYAPELQMIAGVYGMPPLDLAAHWRRSLEALGPTTGFIVMAYTAMAPWYQTGLSSVFVSPLDQQIPQAVKAECKPDTIDAFTSIDQIFTADVLSTAGGLGTNDAQPWSCIVKANSLATAAVPLAPTPALVILGENDPVVAPAIERANFQTQCARGARWQYLECSGAGHGETFAYSIDNALDFIAGRIAGDAMDMCTVHPAEKCRNAP